MRPSPTAARNTLVAIRLVNGTAGLLAPGLLLRRLGVDPGDRSGHYPFRMFGVRNLGLTADLALLPVEQRDRAVRLAVAIHATDTLVALVSGLRHDLPRRAALLTAALSATNTALAVAALREGRDGWTVSAPMPPPHRGR